MKRFLLGVATVLFTGMAAIAQPFMPAHDTVTLTYTGSGPVDIHNDITASVDSKIYWQVSSNNFPASWKTLTSVSICDNMNCWGNNNNNDLIDGNSGEYLSDWYNAGTTELFKATYDLTGLPNGLHYMTVSLRDSATNYSRTITFIVNKGITSAANVAKINENTVLYPNPVNDELNVLFDGSAGIKNIAVYNVIGKAMVVYKVSGNSAKMDVSKLPNGVYFIRLSDAKGQVVSTKRFTKQ